MAMAASTCASLLCNSTSVSPGKTQFHYSPLDFFSYRHHKSRRRSNRVRAVVTESSVPVLGEGSNLEQKEVKAEKRGLRILVAGGGIGGLVFALAAKNKGFDVMVFEKDLSAVRGEGQYRGPIQIQSNALAALEAIDLEVAEQVLKAGCITGDRINGLVDGISGD